MMHEHDIELIVAIAEGEMTPREQQEAEASLATCEACRTDLELQREALAVLRAATPVTMTDLERAALHRNVMAALTPVAKPSDSKSTVPWFQRLMPAMAAAAALMVVVGVGSILVDGADEADLAADPTTTTAAAAAESLRNAAEEGLDESVGGAGFDDMAEATTPPMAALAPEESMIQEYGLISQDELAEVADQLGNLEEADGADFFDVPVKATEPALACAQTALAEGPITAIGRATVDGDQVEIYRIDHLVNVYSAVDCSLTASFE
jgi:hypothetical protein